MRTPSNGGHAKIACEERLYRRTIVWRVAMTVAASLVLGVSTLWFMYDAPREVTGEILVAAAARSDFGAISEITLFTSEGSMALGGEVDVHYSSDGKPAFGAQTAVKGSSAEALPDAGCDQLLVPAGKRARIALADGTTLVVNSRSKVVFPRRFAGAERTIYAQGEVYLEVAHDTEHPFIVEADDFHLQVLGTKFNISNYEGVPASVVLVEGAVAVTDRCDGQVRMAPDDYLAITDGAISERRKVDAGLYVSWTNGIIRLDGSTLESVVQRLSLYYDVPIHCHPQVGERKILGKLVLKEDVEEVLRSIRNIWPMTIERSEQGIYLNK